MNYYQARELEKDGKPSGLWHFTVHNRRSGTYALGYCAENDCQHQSEHEAQECYAEYLLDNMKEPEVLEEDLVNDDETPIQQVRCEYEGCRKVVDSRVYYRFKGDFKHFCKLHRDRESIKKTIWPYQIVSSW